MTGQVKIGREFFSKIKLDYADWRWALVREFLQNSFDAPGCRNVSVHVHHNGRETILQVANDGAPMTREILVNKLLTLGGSGKNFEGENTGGFGVAKSLLYYCHIGYTIVTGDHFVQGVGAEYRLSPATEPFKGTQSIVTVEGEHGTELIAKVKRFARFAQWKGKLTLNGEALTCDLHKGKRRKDLGWGVVYTNQSFENTCLVRINGQPMFTSYTRYKGCVLIELVGKACDSLTSNRDALKYHYQSELADLLAALAVDKRSALREQRAEYKRYMGEKAKNEAKKPKASEGGLAALGIDADAIKTMITKGLGGPKPVRTEQIPQTATEGGGQAGISVVVETQEDVASVSIGPEFIIKNATGMKTPVWYVPGERFSQTSRELVTAWTAILLKLYQIHNISTEFSVGFVFDEESEAEYETGVYGEVYYINPTRLVEENGKRRLEARFDSGWAARWELISTAAHEFVHGAFKLKEHDEDYAGRLTTVMTTVLRLLPEFLPLCRSQAEKTEGEATRAPRTDLFGHPVSAVIRWMGKKGWSFDHARSALDNLNCSQVADGTIRTYLQAGKQGLRGEAAALDADQEAELYAARW